MRRTFKEFYFKSKDSTTFNNIFEKWYKRGHWGDINKDKIRSQQRDWFNKIKNMIYEMDYDSLVMSVKNRDNKVSREMFSKLTNLNINKKSGKFIKEKLKDYLKKQIINEKYSGTTSIGGRTVEYFINPSQKEIKEIMRNDSFGSVRFGVVDNPNADVYAWPGSVLHYEMRKKINFDFGFFYQYMHGDDPNLNADAPEKWKYFSQLKNKKSVFKRIQKMFPKETQIRMYPTPKAKDKTWPDGVYDLKTMKFIRKEDEWPDEI